MDENFRRRLWKYLNGIPSGRDTWRERKVFFENLLEDRDYAIRIAGNENEDGTLELEEVSMERPSEDQVHKAAQIFFKLVAKLNSSDMK